MERKEEGEDRRGQRKEEESRREEKDFETVGVLGSGNFAVCVLLMAPTGHLFAGKRFEKGRVFEEECDIHRRLSHPNIVKFHDVWVTAAHFYMLMEYCPDGDLRSWIQSFGPWREALAAPKFAPLVDALRYLHQEARVVHADISPANILLSQTGRLKFTDFGLAEHLPDEKDQIKGTRGTLEHMAPEILDGTPYSFDVDIWALGTVLYFALTGCLLFDADESSSLTRQIRETEPTFPPEPLLSPHAQAVLQIMVKRQPRATHEQLLNHPFFSPFDSSSM